MKNKFVFTAEIAKILVTIRKSAKLTQAEVANQMGLSSKSAKKYISNLESGKIKNPSLRTIISYLDACSVSYETFFARLSQIRSAQNHREIMEQVTLPANLRLQKKIDRDTALYAHKIRHQIRTPILDIEKLKLKIERELTKYLSDHQINQEQIRIYQDFAAHILQRALNPKPNPPLDINPWQKSGGRPLLLSYINGMIYKIVHKEQKKLSKRKIPTTEKQQKMAIGFLKYRAMIEQVEAEVHKLLNELQVPFVLYFAYKDFARECFSNLKKLYYRDSALLSQRFAESIKKWQRMKLDENVLIKVKELTINEFQKLYPKPTK